MVVSNDTFPLLLVSVKLRQDSEHKESHLPRHQFLFKKGSHLVDGNVGEMKLWKSIEQDYIGTYKVNLSSSN